MGYLNPLEQLPAVQKLRSLPAAQRKTLRAQFLALRAVCDELAHQAWDGAKRRPQEASFWRASATYSRHVAVALKTAPDQQATDAPKTSGLV
jgi:hypothetical protein